MFALPVKRSILRQKRGSADDGAQCTDETCVAGAPMHPARPSGSACNQNGGNICDGASLCVTCNQDSQCPSGNACSAPKCNSGTCGFQFLPAGTVLASVDTVDSADVAVHPVVSRACHALQTGDASRIRQLFGLVLKAA